MKKVALLLWLTIFGVFCLSGPAQAVIPLEYDLVILPLPSGWYGPSEANAIDNDGTIVSSNGVYWVPGDYTPLRIPGQYGPGQAYAIKEGTIYGKALNVVGWQRAFSWKPGAPQLTYLGFLPDMYDSVAYAPMAGCAYDHYTSASEQACYFTGGDTAVALSMKQSCVLGRNGNVYVGWEIIDPGIQHAVLWDGGPNGRQDLSPGASYAAATAIVLPIAVYKVTGYIGDNPFIWDQDKGLRKNMNISSAKGLAINNKSQIVGSSYAFGSWPVAFIWEEGQGTVLLNSLVVNRGTFEIAEARGINDKGEIVGWGYYQSSQPEKQAFLLQPKKRVAPVVAAICLELLLMD